MIDRGDIEGLFGKWLDMIGDRTLREKVVEAWVSGCKLGGWESVDELKHMPFTLATDPEGINFIEHTIAVTMGAIGLAKAQMETYRGKMPYEINMDRLIAGALLHDIGKLVEIEGDGEGGWRMSYTGRCIRHPISGVVLAKSVGIGDDVVNVIACHAKEGEGRPQYVETILVHQADFATFNPLVMRKAGKLIE